LEKPRKMKRGNIAAPACTYNHGVIHSIA
jgi:hypothetical protein